jgi:hypothetical protein
MVQPVIFLHLIIQWWKVWVIWKDNELSAQVMCDGSGGGVSGVRIPTSKEFHLALFLACVSWGLPSPSPSCCLPFLQSPPGPLLTLSLRLGR